MTRKVAFDLSILQLIFRLFFTGGRVPTRTIWYIYPRACYRWMQYLSAVALTPAHKSYGLISPKMYTSVADKKIKKKYTHTHFSSKTSTNCRHFGPENVTTSGPASHYAEKISRSAGIVIFFYLSQASSSVFVQLKSPLSRSGEASSLHRYIVWPTCDVKMAIDWGLKFIYVIIYDIFFLNVTITTTFNWLFKSFLKKLSFLGNSGKNMVVLPKKHDVPFIKKFFDNKKSQNKYQYLIKNFWFKII